MDEKRPPGDPGGLYRHAVPAAAMSGAGSTGTTKLSTRSRHCLPDGVCDVRTTIRRSTPGAGYASGVDRGRKCTSGLYKTLVARATHRMEASRSLCTGNILRLVNTGGKQ